MSKTELVERADLEMRIGPADFLERATPARKINQRSQISKRGDALFRRHFLFHKIPSSLLNRPSGPAGSASR